jgi:hypothetical protein
MVALKDFKYKIIKSFLNKTEIHLLKEYCVNRHRTNETNFDFNQNNNGDTFFYKDPLIEVILKDKKNIIEVSLNVELYETYSFWRCYTFNADLKKHTDRPSCELSATIFIGSDNKEWPIFMEGVPVNLEPGDAVIYSGCNVEHWREPYEGDYHIQAFLHYVDKNGPYADHRKDRRLNENTTK